ncbi:serine hydrolase domain-containing protein [Novosphingobium profundi]|uniref:serine hydrolase domain-containing protein n=1 Tax=Novosphingobium profundi TaxID=1774954 RepID=UPI001CFDBFAB|nr:serine hydrolase domain-containing protein [Novosphingobium profundi]
MVLLRIFAAFALLFGCTALTAQDSANPLAPKIAESGHFIPGASSSKAGGASSLPPITKADVDTWLDGYMPYALDINDIPGAVVVIVKDGKVLTARGFGYADVAKRKPVDPARSLFRPGSVSKLFTWTAVMQQVDAGKIDLDADVNAYLDFRIPPRDGKPITMRQIMTHTAGFEESGKGVVFYDAKYDQPLATYIKSHLPKRIFVPGTTPAYSNYATALAGYIVARVSGETFDDYVERHIFAPLGMRHSTFRQPLPARLKEYMAVGYPKPGVSKGFEVVGPAPAGSLASTGLDMARFMIAHLQGGEFEGKRILSAQTARMMLDSPLAPVDPASLVAPLNRMELGFFEINLNGHTAVGHLGDLNAFHTSLDLLPAQNLGIYISVNGSGKAGAGGSLRLSLPSDFAKRYLPAPEPAKLGVSIEDARKHAQMMTGLWEASRRGQTTFFSALYFVGQTQIAVNEDGTLSVPAILATNGRPREWVEVAPFVWKDRNGQERLAAQVVDGEVVRWSFDLASPWEVFDRVPAAKSGSWLKPALIAGLTVLLLTFLFWPAAWLVRRRYKADPPLNGNALRACRAARIMAGLCVALMAGWITLFLMILELFPDDPAMFDPWAWVLQIAGAIILVGALPITGWNLYLTWTGQRPWTRKAWSLLVFLSSLTLLYFAAQFGLIAMTVTY